MCCTSFICCYYVHVLRAEADIHCCTSGCDIYGTNLPHMASNEVGSWFSLNLKQVVRVFFPDIATDHMFRYHADRHAMQIDSSSFRWLRTTPSHKEALITSLAQPVVPSLLAFISQEGQGSNAEMVARTCPNTLSTSSSCTNWNSSRKTGQDCALDTSLDSPAITLESKGFARPKGYPRKIEGSSLPAPWIPCVSFGWTGMILGSQDNWLI